MGLGVRRAVPGRGDLRQLPAPQARPARAAADPHPARRRLQPAPATGSRTREPMSFTGRFGRLGSGRGRLSLRSRLLAGLITVTALFLIVMGVVTAVVIGHTEQDQFNTDLQLTAKSTPKEIANAANGYVAADVSARTGQVTLLTQPSRNALDLQEWLTGLVAQGGAYAFLKANNGQVFDVALPDGGSAVAATVRVVDLDAVQSAETGGLLPADRNAIVVARPLSAVGSEVRRLVAAELITGAILLALLAVGGRWLISRGLAPLDRMASTADLITSNGDLTARMSDPDDRQEIGRLAAAINTMLDRIQQAFGARLRSEQKVRQFAADASHELRTPLTTIRGYAELYRQGALGPEQLPNAMRRIEQEAERMSTLVAELLELARLDRNSSLDLTETDLAGVVRDAVADAIAVEPQRPARAEAPPRLVAVVDEARIRQVLGNLLGNVRAHTPPTAPVVVRLGEISGGVLIEVADGGPGMSAQDASRAFDRFHRASAASAPEEQDQDGNGADLRTVSVAGAEPWAAHDATGGEPGYPRSATALSARHQERHSGGHAKTERSSGSGLGLSIVQAIADAHGGRATLESRPGQGTRVRVWLPVRIVP